MEAKVGRIRRRTVEALNTRFQSEAAARVAYYASHPELIEQRLRELDEEWDVERAIELEAAGTVFTGFALGIMAGKKWFLLSVMASSMLLLHNLTGTYPLLPLFRRLGFRTPHGIDQERYALKAIRGDFKGVPRVQKHERARTAFEAAHPSLAPGSTLTPAI